MNTNFAAYIQTQKMRIRAERADEIDFISRGGVVTLGGAVAAVRDAEDILSEMDGLRGLNTRERARSRRKGLRRGIGRPCRAGAFSCGAPYQLNTGA